MASGTLGSSLKHLRDLFGGGTAVGLGDGELLRRFAASHDGPAFAALVARHGPMVAATCRAVLSDHHDVEDAFQTTFLVLARKAVSLRAGDALGGWLHRVAYRAAVQLDIERKRRRQHESELSAMDVPDTTRPGLDFDLSSILHEEIDRLPDSQRLPVVLCDLEGLTYEQAAGRLQWTVPTLYHRLAKGRKRLRNRLIRRGVTAAAAAAAMELSQASATAAVPSAWAQAAVSAATGGPIPAAVAALAHSLVRSLLMARLKIAFVAILAMVALASVGVVAAGAARPDTPKPPPLAPAAAPIADEPKADAGPTAKTVTLAVEARDLSTDTPTPDVLIELRTLASEPKPSARTGASGTARLSIPADTRYLYLTASREGFVPLGIRWERDAGSTTPPDHLLFQMDRATTIGGRVVDQDRKPIAGATVVIDVEKVYPRSPQRVNLQFRSIPTDANGRWSFTGVPENPDSLKLTAYHYLCLTERTCFLPEEFKPLSALRDGSATLQLRRGTIVDGSVVGPDGRPVPGAEIIVGNDRRYGNSIPPAKADAQGHFALGFTPGIATTLIVLHPGFGPVMQSIRVGSEPRRVTLRLPPAHTMSVRVIGRDGKPLPSAWIGVRSWRGSEAIAQYFRTDLDGRFTWNDAPGDEVRISVYADGHCGKQDLPLLPDHPVEIALTTPTKIKGTVLDSGTGRPIPRFSLLDGSVWEGRRGVVWQRGLSIDRDAKKAAGSFELTLSSEPGARCVIRVEAEGYLPGDSGIITSDGGHQAFTFRLAPSGPIRGTIRKPDGTPVGGIFVYLVLGDYEQRLDNGDFFRGEHRLRAKTAPDGRFTLPPQKDDYLLVALSDAGFAAARRSDLRGDDTIRLQPWARIAGTVKIDGKPAADLDLCSVPNEPQPVEGELRLGNYLFVKTDAGGRFEMPRVMPGRHVIQQKVLNNLDRRCWYVDMATLDVASGQTYDLRIGERGRLITGRLAIPTDGGWMVRKASIEPSAPKGPSPPIGVHVLNDGRFRALDLPPGDYALRIALHEPPPDNACGWGRLVAAYTRDFTVMGKAGDSPLDLGTLQPVELGGKPLRVGDAAPDFTVKTLDGKDLSLADFKGRFVLLDFWATWCAPCVAEMPNLDAVRKAFGADPRFAMVSLSLDETPAEARSFVKSQKLTWPQCHVGPESPVVASYNATAIPATFLIGPDGRILATDLRGEKMKTTIAQALGRRKTAGDAAAR
jgi:RNA polymerase sigma factor (sigma-70 family)